MEGCFQSWMCTSRVTVQTAVQFTPEALPRWLRSICHSPGACFWIYIQIKQHFSEESFVQVNYQHLKKMKAPYNCSDQPRLSLRNYAIMATWRLKPSLGTDNIHSHRCQAVFSLSGKRGRTFISASFLRFGNSRGIVSTDCITLLISLLHQDITAWGK